MSINGKLLTIKVDNLNPCDTIIFRHLHSNDVNKAHWYFEEFTILKAYGNWRIFGTLIDGLFHYVEA